MYFSVDREVVALVHCSQFFKYFKSDVFLGRSRGRCIGSMLTVFRMYLYLSVDREVVALVQCSEFFFFLLKKRFIVTGLVGLSKT